MFVVVFLGAAMVKIFSHVLPVDKKIIILNN